MKRKIKRLCPTILDGLPTAVYSQALSTLLHAAGSFLPAPFSGLGRLLSSLAERPGVPEFPQAHHIDTVCLAWTPDRHRAAEDRTPNLTPSSSLDLQSSWLQDHATGPGRRERDSGI
ncbi:hypothetical protein TNIN_225041 [Trichonephila inaurata madagascariensis]|uniref:Uncharacterized protein n=1 Tax=Trichonephila inaurata madagascariensis TaxID=2747483 RepID=A0A8X6WPK6_9ARAC|nr:hypothetical protein TNIN_225041 [Trichonephila inaurata madagascariensis]